MRREGGGERQAWARDTGLEGGEQRSSCPRRKQDSRSLDWPGQPACRSSGPLPQPGSPLDPNRPWSKEATARDAAAGSIFLLPFPDSPALLFRKSLSRAHIFSHDSVHTDKDPHPTITDEICIDSKIKSNEKKIGSQPDPTVPDCCIEVAERHFFIVSRFQLTTSSSPILPLLV